ncbi:RibD family protein [Modicisalibacter muralis]|uniref:RibD family protein n=1 Tax=Modicisalibacter muralis TaxID=119000 RepID=UPI001FDFA8A3|nr:RibD family protein [Halomonas muralis]
MALSLALGDWRLDVRRGGAWHCDGSVDDDVRDLLDCLLPLVARAEPLAIAQLGQSLDGRIATVTGASHYVNGVESRRHLHRLRALVDAVLVGAGTVDADDPRLSVRLVDGHNPLRVVLDPRGRLPAERHVFQSGEAPTLHLVGAGAPTIGPVGGHVERVVLPLGEGAIVEPRAVLDMLAARGLGRVLIEGGGLTVSRFLEAGVLHRLHLLVAPLLIGSGRPGLSLTPIDTLDRALRPVSRTFTCGDDTLFDLTLAAAPVTTGVGGPATHQE